MSAAKDLRDVQILNLVMRGMKLGRIATQLGLHRNTITKILQKPKIKDLLDTIKKELAQQVITNMIEHHKAAQQERGRKRVLRRGQGTPLPREHNPFVANDICKNGHDHSKEDIAIPLEPRRKYHCPSEISSRKHHPDKWKQGTLAEGRAVGVPACEICFGIPR